VNYYYGLVNELLNKNIDATDGYSIASISSEYKSAAYTSLARLFLKNGEYNKCIAYTQKAIEFNARNIIALQLQLVAYRKSNNIVAANQTIQSIQAIDPLNHFSAHEKHLITGKKNDADNFITNIKNEMPNETKFQIAAEYVEMGLHAEALEVVSHCDQTALTNYWSAYLSMKLLLPYENYLNSAKLQSPDFVFPNRSADFDVLNWITSVSDDWKARYFLAILYRDRNRLAEAKELVRSLKVLPNYAPFYVFSAQLFENQDDNAVLLDLKQAHKLAPEHWRYVKHLVEYYLRHKNYTEALNIVEPYFQKNQQNYIIGMLYVKSLILNERYLEANALLAKLNIIPFEGATQGHELYREVKINLALMELNKKDYNKAKRFLEEAQLWPENLGVGMPYKEDIDDRLENWITYLIAKAEKSSMAITNNLLNKILAFAPAIDNTVANFYTSNHWITYLAYSKLGKESAGKSWLINQVSKYPKSSSNDWLKNKINKTNSSINRLEINVDVTAKLIDKLPND
jgi:tetratricopeptide (TPR) repeat protein